MDTNYSKSYLAAETAATSRQRNLEDVIVVLNISRSTFKKGLNCSADYKMGVHVESRS
jgi:hypothetical protein